MAITKMWAHKRLNQRPEAFSDAKKSISDGIYYVMNPDKTTMQGLERLSSAEPDGIIAKVYESLASGMDYASDESKTMQGEDLATCFSKSDICRFVSTINSSPNKNAIEDFAYFIDLFDKCENDITHYHAVQSFMGYECSPEIAHEIGVKLAKNMWGNAFQTMICTHLNTENIHNHFIVNATSFKDGSRLQYNKTMYQKLRYESDLLCKEYGLSTINTKNARKSGSIPYKLLEMEKSGKATHLNIAKNILDISLSQATSLEELRELLYDYQYEIDFSPNHKHWTIKSFGWDKPVRITRIAEKYGDAYSKEGIFERLNGEKFYDPYEDPVNQVKIYKVRGKVDLKNNKYRVAKGYRALYLHYLYKLGVLPKKRNVFSTRYAAYLNYKYRDDIININAIVDEAKLLNKYKIETYDQLFDLQKSFQMKVDELGKVKRRKGTTTVEKANINDEIKEFKSQIRMVDRIYDRSTNIEEKLEKNKTLSKNKSSEESKYLIR